jgi:hypothetical protein
MPERVVITDATNIVRPLSPSGTPFDSTGQCTLLKVRAKSPL